MRTILAWALVFSMFFMVACESSMSRDLARKRHAVSLLEHARSVHWGRDWDEVISLSTQAIEADPTNPWTYSMRGAAHNALGNYREAIRDLNAALEISPDYAPAYINKAISFLRLGDLPIARMNADEALVLDRGNLTVLMTAAEVYSSSGDVDTACMLLEEAVDRGFEDFEVIRSRESFRELFYSECFTRVHRSSHAHPPDSP
ncbi:MAG: tetratricopeptide repeat protein [Thermodesulfovibrionales bacterium]|nr:tetratricopeptide repeat protein [Thermodesulfovibrionales bacterium]